jgi:hypothetical protein
VAVGILRVRIPKLHATTDGTPTVVRRLAADAETKVA